MYGKHLNENKNGFGSNQQTPYFAMFTCLCKGEGRTLCALSVSWTDFVKH